MLISFATFAFNNQDLVYPKISTNEFHIKAEGIGHPLINPIVRVKNDFVISGLPSAMIITGANMAGKSTFLRTVAVNLLLAMLDQPCAIDPFPKLNNPKKRTKNEPIIKMGVCIFESVITPFIPPITVNTPVRRTNPTAPTQKFSPSKLSRKIPPVKAVTLTFVSTYDIRVMIDNHELVLRV